MWYDALNIMKKQSGKTIENIASESGVPLGTLFKVFSGATKDPKLSTVKSVIHAMGYSLDDLYRFDPDETEKSPDPASTESEDDVKERISILSDTFARLGWLDASGDISDEQLKIVRGVFIMLDEIFGS